MRSPLFAVVLVFLTQQLSGAAEFRASVFLVEGKKVTFIKDDGARPITLNVADKFVVLQGGTNDATKKFEGAIVEKRLEYHLFKELKLLSKIPLRGQIYHLMHLVTNADNEITEIRLFDDVAAKITKVDDKNLTMIQMWGRGFYGGGNEGPPRQSHLWDKVKVVKGWLNPATRKFEGTEVEGGLKNDIFKSTVHARVTSRPVEGVILIRVFDKAKIKK